MDNNTDLPINTSPNPSPAELLHTFASAFLVKGDNNDYTHTLMSGASDPTRLYVPSVAEKNLMELFGDAASDADAGAVLTERRKAVSPLAFRAAGIAEETLDDFLDRVVEVALEYVEIDVMTVYAVSRRGPDGPDGPDGGPGEIQIIFPDVVATPPVLRAILEHAGDSVKEEADWLVFGSGQEKWEVLRYCVVDVMAGSVNHMEPSLVPAQSLMSDLSVRVGVSEESRHTALGVSVRNGAGGAGGATGALLKSEQMQKWFVEFGRLSRRYAKIMGDGAGGRGAGRGRGRGGGRGRGRGRGKGGST